MHSAPLRPASLWYCPLQHPWPLTQAARPRNMVVTGSSERDAGLEWTRASIRLPGPIDLQAELAAPLRQVLSAQERSKLDLADDSTFYSTPRLMQHTDEGFRRRLTDVYQQHLQQGWRVLDLCSSAHSHLPAGLPLTVDGHGMNEAELAANPALSSWWVQDLNQQPQLSRLESSSLDAVLCASGIMYLQQPEAVLAEVLRALKPGGVLVVSFSSHCYADKAIAAWLEQPSLTDKAELVQQLLAAAGFTPAAVEVVLWEPLQQPGSAAAAVAALTSSSSGSDNSSSGGPDPFAAVIATKLPAGLQAADPSGGAAALTPPALREIDMNTRAVAGGNAPSPATLERWAFAYRQMVADARDLGIPASAIPPLPPNPTEAQLREARDHLSGMIASFLSSGL